MDPNTFNRVRTKFYEIYRIFGLMDKNPKIRQKILNTRLVSGKILFSLLIILSHVENKIPLVTTILNIIYKKTGKTD